MSGAKSNAFIAETLAQYTPRAATYDLSNGGWHAELGRDYVAWLPPPKGGAVLDLACGTGLVALPYAEAVGRDGIVVGVDVTEAMLNEARRKPLAEGSGKVDWILGDIMDVSSVDAVQAVVKSRGGFDVISCCSAFVLLENPAGAIKEWVALLKPGTGRLIIDVPTEDRTLQYLLNYPLRRALGKAMTYDFDWIKDVHTVEKMFEDAGLEVEKSFRTRSYTPETWYTAGQAAEVFEHKTRESGLWKGMIETWEAEGGEGGAEKIKEVWAQIWEENLNEEGMLWDGHALYVTVGRRRE
jgi:ubiquinone/menaquinone biosynthesis C-methylase UbiE